MNALTVKAWMQAATPRFLKLYWNRLETSPLGCRLLRGAFWSLVGATVARACGFLATVMVARMLGRENFGALGVINSTVGMFGVFAGFGAGLTATKYVAEYQRFDSIRAGRVLALCRVVAWISGGAMTVILLFAGPWLATHTLARPELGRLLQLSATLLLLGAVNGAQTGALTGFEAFRAIAAINTITGLANFPFVLAGAYWFGLLGVVWALLVNSFLGCVLNYGVLRHRARQAGIRISLEKGDWRAEWPVLWRFSLPAVLSGAMVGPVSWGASALLVNQPDGYAHMGTFNAANQFQCLLGFLGGMLAAPLLPMLASERRRRSDRLETVNMLLNWTLGVAVALPLMAFPELVELLFGQKYRSPEFRQTLLLVLFFCCIMLYKQGVSRALTVRDMLWWGVLSNGTWAMALMGSAILTVRWGATGLACSYLLAYVVSTILFVPLYNSRGLVPRGTLFSVHALLIWFSITCVAGTTAFGASWPLRLGIFSVATPVVFRSFWRLTVRQQSPNRLPSNG